MELAEAKWPPKTGSKLYNVIYADPPWSFTPYSEATGMDRAADNDYPTMTTEQICNIEIPAAEDAALFLWATMPMLKDALLVMEAWCFTRARIHGHGTCASFYNAMISRLSGPLNRILLEESGRRYSRAKNP